MFRILIVSHAPLASAMAKVACDIMGQDAPVYALDTRIDQSPEGRQKQANDMIEELLADGEVLLLVDFLGGTPSNVVIPHLGREGLEIVTGFNVPLVFKAVEWAREGKPIGEAALALKAYAANHIERVSDRLSKP